MLQAQPRKNQIIRTRSRVNEFFRVLDVREKQSPYHHKDPIRIEIDYRLIVHPDGRTVKKSTTRHMEVGGKSDGGSVHEVTRQDIEEIIDGLKGEQKLWEQFIKENYP